MEAYKIIETFRGIVDAYAIDIFIENHVQKLPGSWQSMFDSMEPEAWIDILNVDMSINRILPLSFLCLRQLFVKYTKKRAVCSSPAELGCLLGFKTEERSYPKVTSRENVRRRIKEKKQHEIDRLIYTLKNIIRAGADFDFAVDVGAGIGHLSRFVAMELPQVEVLSIEVNSQFVETANQIDQKMKSTLTGELPKRIECLLDEHSDSCITKNGKGESGLLLGLHPCGDLSATILRAFANYNSLNSVMLIGCCYHKLNDGADKLFRQEWDLPKQKTTSRPGFPLSLKFADVKLSYAARELACHAVEHFAKTLEKDEILPKKHFYRAVVELALWEDGHQEIYRHIPVKGVKNVESLPFEEYVEAALHGQDGFLKVVMEQTHSNPKVRKYLENPDTFIQQTMFFYYLRLLFAPIVEHVLVADRLQYLREGGFSAHVIPLFDPVISPRNLVIFAHK